jgi:hypothetical protein
MKIISRKISSRFCFRRVENVVCIVHYTPRFARLQCPGVLAGHNMLKARIRRKVVSGFGRLAIVSILNINNNDAFCLVILALYRG